MKRKEIVKNYLRTWFVLDLLASFPYSEIFNRTDLSDNLRGGSALSKTP